MKSFKLAKKGNCKKGLEHLFVKIRDAGMVSWIRIELPQLTYSLWECEHCEKITESN